MAAQLLRLLHVLHALATLTPTPPTQHPCCHTHCVAVERLLHYTSLDQEPATVAQGGPPPPKGWPSAGGIEYRGVTAVYRPGLPPVLRGLTFTLEVGVGAVCQMGAAGWALMGTADG